MASRLETCADEAIVRDFPAVVGAFEVDGSGVAGERGDLTAAVLDDAVDDDSHGGLLRWPVRHCCWSVSVLE